MRQKAHGQVRRSQVITTYGPGALIDLPQESAIVAGLDEWPPAHKLEEIDEPRLARKLQAITGVATPQLLAPPPASSDPGARPTGIGAWRFPEWFVVQAADAGEGTSHTWSRRLVHRKALDQKRRFEGRDVVATRFVRGCPRGHVDDLDWRRFVHRPGNECPPTRPLWLDEQGTTGDLTDLVVRCECGATRRLSDASMIEINPLGTCRGARPWLGRDTNEECNLPSRLLVRTASNAWFPQVLSVLSIPERGAAVETAVRELWDDLQIVNDAAGLAFIKGKPKVAAALAPFDDDEVLTAVGNVKGTGAGSDRSVKEIELEALLAAPEGFGDDVPVNLDFHARRLPDAMWRRTARVVGVEAVIQLHRLREVMALSGFTRFEAVTPDIHGEYETDVERAAIALEPSWFPAVENRGEGLFLRLRTDAVHAWLERTAVRDRLDGLVRGHQQWAERRNSARPFPGEQSAAGGSQTVVAQTAGVAPVAQREAGLQDVVHLAGPRIVGMNVLEMLTASAQVLQTSLVLAVGVTAVDHPPVAHEHAVEVGPQDRLRVFESAARADGVDGRRRGDGRPQPVAAGADAPTGLIGRDHRSVADLLAQRLVGRRRVACRTMQQIREAPRRHLQAEPGLQQIGDLGQRQAAVAVQLDDQRDHTGTELCAGRPQRVGGLQGVAALDTPPTLRAVADLDVEAAHQRAHRGEVFLILRRRAGHFDRAAAVRTARRRRRRDGLVDPRRTRAAPLPAIARTGPPAGMAAATLWPLLGERRGLPASRAALGSQLLFQVLVLALQPLDLTLQAAVLTMHALVARQFVTQSRDFPVLSLDDNVPRIPLGWGLFQDGAHAAQQTHAPLLSAPRSKTFTPTRGFCPDPAKDSDRVRRERRHSSAGANPARQLSLQPVAVGADDGGNDIG